VSRDERRSLFNVFFQIYGSSSCKIRVPLVDACDLSSKSKLKM
jgi:hypothetical protein